MEFGTHPVTSMERRVGTTYVARSEPIETVPWKSPMLMVHGAYHDWWAFDQWRAFFAASGWSSEALSLRDRQAELGEATDLTDYLEVVVEVARTYERPPILIGHSMGGLLAQKAAEILPVRALVLVASVGPGQLGAHDPENDVVDYSREYADELDERFISRESHAAVAQRLVIESGRALKSLRTGTMSVDASRIAAPILALGGRRDQTRVHAADRIADVYGGDVKWFDNGRHDLMIEDGWFTTAVVASDWLIAKVGEAAWPR